MQGLAFFGEGQAHPALILGVSCPVNETHGLKPLEQRCQGSGIKEETFAELLDRHIAAFPQDQHGEILRIGKTELFKQGLIGLVDGVHG